MNPLGKVKSQNWGTISNGDPVKIKGERGQFTFLSHVKVSSTGDEYIEVYGGANGHLMFRSFSADRVRPARKK